MWSRLERLAQVADEADLEVRRRGRGVAALALVAAVVSLVNASLYFTLDALVDAGLAALCALGGLMMLVVWRRTRSITWVIDVAAAWFLVLLLVGAVATQAFAWLAWTAVVPGAAFYAAGLKSGLRWSALTAVGLVIASALVLTAPVIVVPGPLLVRLWRVITIPPTFAALAYFFELSRLRSASELEQARRAAELASDAKGRLLARVSHEIRTPLNAILGLNQSLLHEQGLPPGAHADLLLMRASGNGLLSLINDLLDVARAEAGKLELHPAPVDLVRLAREVTALYREQAVKSGVALELESPEVAELWVLTDDVRVRQVLGNLVSNALKFTQSGSVTVRVEVGPESNGRIGVRLSVTDTGRGISQSGVIRLFDPFTQVHADLAHQGSGLGLAISKELAAHLGGDLTVTSTVDQGSVFTLTLTLERTARPTQTSALPPPLPPFRALVVDDNALNRRVASALLQRLGATVAEAADGQQAVAAAFDASCDVVLMDLQMPVMDGLEATRRLRARGFVGPVVALTASAGTDTERDCKAAGMNACLVKPLVLEHLHGTLAAVLGASRPAA